MIKSQAVTAIICAILAAVLGIVYFAVVEPSLIVEEEKVTPIELIDPLEVRAYDQTRVYMYPIIGSERISKIEVHNDNGGYTFYKNSKKGYVLEGMEDAPYASMALVYLRSTIGSPIAAERYLIDENTDLSVYGLAESDTPGYYIVTDDNKTSHKRPFL